jgi:hypothetical protein
MKLFRTINSQFDPNQPLIEWKGDVQGIIAARRAAEMAERSAGYRLRVVGRVSGIHRITRTMGAPLEIAA